MGKKDKVKKSLPWQGRQGDVLVIRRDGKPVGSEQPATADGGVVLALGEATGHSHILRGSDRVTHFRTTVEGGGGGGFDIVQLVGSGELRHEVGTERALSGDHGTVSLGEGCYEVRRQSEYVPEAIRNVAD